VSSGGTLVVLTGGSALAPHLLSGATLVFAATVSGFTVSKGVTLVVSGTTASKTKVLAGGTLELVAGATVISGGTSASIDLSGHYTSASFHISAGDGGSVAIFDPPVIAQQSTLGFPDALGGIEKSADTVVGDTVAGKLAHNYMASEFASVIDGHAGVPPTEPEHAGRQLLLTHPHGR